MAATIILPKNSKGHLSVGLGTRVFLDGVEVKEVSSVGIPQFGRDEILCVTITVPLEDIRYADE